jgi:hypothetical protein
MLDKVLAARKPDSRTLGEAAGNPDGTFHLGRTAEWLTGGLVSSAEAMWMARRIRQLQNVEGRPKAEVLATVREEAKAKPWLTAG